MAKNPSDIQSFRRLREQADQLSAFAKAAPLLQPLLSAAGVDTTSLAEQFQSAQNLRKQVDDLAETMDRFNQLFASRGWIAYGFLNTELASSAVAMAAGGDVAGAEHLLVRHYDADHVALELRMLSTIKAFRSRMRLGQLALDDYRAERFHACIPVVLTLLDGMVNELVNLGFFSKDVDLTAWDSMAASDSGLKELQKLLFKTRSKTRTEVIDVPYRNGILHGMDLGYDTRIVAAKCWVALFATADWARKIEGGEKYEPPPEPAPTAGDTLRTIALNRSVKRQLQAWSPRPSIDLRNTAAGSPEAALTEFLTAWKSKNFGTMAKRLGTHDRRPQNQRAGEVRGFYQGLELHEFEILSVVDAAAAVSEVEVKGSGTQYGFRFADVCTFRLVHLDVNREPLMHGQPGGTWYVVHWNPWQHSINLKEGRKGHPEIDEGDRGDR